MKNIGVVSLLALASVSVAQGPGAETGAAPTSFSLDFKQGEVTVGADLARLRLPPEFLFLGPKDSERVLVELWGNPKGAAPLGMVFPADTDPRDPESWGVVITFEEDGYVEDKEADSIDYAAMLKEMQADTVAANEERRKAGYEPVELVGWATPPRYDKLAKKLYWAKELKFGASPDHTLNYNIRILGRRGVLVLNAVAGMGQLDAVEAATPGILKFVDFQPGHRYADYVAGKDRMAAYGIGALIAGKVAAKAGLFKVLLGFLFAAKKLIIVGIAALFAMARRFFAGKKEE